MTLNYDFGENFEFEIANWQIIEFLAQQMIKEGKIEKTKATMDTAMFIMDRFNLYEDEEILEDYEEEMKEYFKDNAEEEYRKAIEREENPLGNVGMSESDFI